MRVSVSVGWEVAITIVLGSSLSSAVAERVLCTLDPYLFRPTSCAWLGAR
jgi:hypothetical protein